jgi:hypothetical protein
MAAVNPLESLFYFYNPTTVAFGKVEFKTWVTAMYQETGDYLAL